MLVLGVGVGPSASVSPGLCALDPCPTMRIRLLCALFGSCASHPVWQILFDFRPLFGAHKPPSFTRSCTEGWGAQMPSVFDTSLYWARDRLEASAGANFTNLYLQTLRMRSYMLKSSASPA